MFISRESDYAVRVVRALAYGEKKTVSEISEAENITAQFTYKIAKKLEKAGILRIYRGPKGGYSLDRSLEELTLFDVLHAVDDKLFIVDCMEAGYRCTQNTPEASCRVHEEFCRIQGNLIEDMKAKKLAEIFLTDNP